MHIKIWLLSGIVWTMATIVCAEEYPRVLPDGTYTAVACVTNACPCTQADETFRATFDMPGEYSLQIPGEAIDAGSMICTTIENSAGEVVRESMTNTPCDGVSEVRHHTNKKRSIQSKMAKKSTKQLLAFIQSALMGIESTDQGDVIITAITNYLENFDASDTDAMMSIVTGCNQNDASMMDAFMTAKDGDDALVEMDATITNYMIESDEKYTRLEFAEDELTDALLQTDESLVPDRLKDKLATNHEWRLAMGRVNRLMDQFNELKIQLIQSDYHDIVDELRPDIDQLITDLSEEKELLLRMKQQHIGCNNDCYNQFFGSDGDYVNIKNEKSNRPSTKSITGKTATDSSLDHLDQTEYVLYQLLIHLSEEDPLSNQEEMVANAEDAYNREKVKVNKKRTNKIQVKQPPTLPNVPVSNGGSTGAGSVPNVPVSNGGSAGAGSVPDIVQSIKTVYDDRKWCQKNTDSVSENDSCQSLSTSGKQTCTTLVPESIGASFCNILDLNAQTYLPTNRQK